MCSRVCVYVYVCVLLKTSAMLSALPFAAMDAFDEDSSGEADAAAGHAETETDAGCRAEELSVNEETRDDHFENGD